MGAQPRVVGEPVLAGPCAVPLERGERVACLPVRPDRGDEIGESRLGRETTHLLQQRAGQPPAAVPRSHHRLHRGQRGGLDAFGVLGDGQDDDVVDPAREVFDLAVPRERKGVGHAQDLVGGLVDQVQLERWMIVEEMVPVQVDGAAVQQELGPGRADGLVPAFVQVRSLAEADGAHRHRVSLSVCLPCARAADRLPWTRAATHLRGGPPPHGLTDRSSARRGDARRRGRRLHEVAGHRRSRDQVEGSDRGADRQHDHRRRVSRRHQGRVRRPRSSAPPPRNRVRRSRSRSCRPTTRAT